MDAHEYGECILSINRLIDLRSGDSRFTINDQILYKLVKAVLEYDENNEVLYIYIYRVQVLYKNVKIMKIVKQ